MFHRFGRDREEVSLPQAANRACSRQSEHRCRETEIFLVVLLSLTRIESASQGSGRDHISNDTLTEV